jgi:alkylation response protein AidB-like acyl-CoA dehydrogenase
MNPVAAAHALAPTIAARAADTEAARRLPADLAADMAAAGLFRLTIPKSLGGHEALAQTFFDTLEILGRADAATGWCAMIANTTALASAWLPTPHATEVFGNPLGISGGVFAPMGKAVADGDDFVVAGRWAWASGSANCGWLTGGALIFDDGKLRTLANGAPDHRMMFFRREEVELIDTWDASGMRGTGSGDMSVSNVRVPRARSVSFLTDTPTETGPLYAFPPFGLLALGIAAVAAGNARAALDDLKTLAMTKKGAGSSRTLAERGTVQAEFAQSETRLEAGRALVTREIATAWARAERGEAFDAPLRARLRAAATHLVRTASDVVRSAYDMAGGTAVYSIHPLQRRLRDAHVATQHMMVGPPTWELVGRVMLGMPTDDMAL